MAGIVGRSAECEAVDHLLARARSGHSGALVMRGEAGIGKTALLKYARDTAVTSRFRVETAGGAESETQFAFAGLHQLCAPLMDRAGALPDPQQVALGVAFGQRSGAAPDPFLVGLATLHLLAEVAEEAPLLCLVDDAQWLDQESAQVLAFVARRVVAEQVALVFGLRDTDRGPGPFIGLPELRLVGLRESDARAVLAAAVRAPLDDGVRDRIVAEARGNPLALVELPRSTEPTQLAGGFGLPDVQGLPRRIEESYQRRSQALPAETQLLLLVAAAEPTGDVALLLRAAAHLGVAPEAAAPAEAAELLQIDSRVRFRHPLARSAVYAAASPPDHRRVHGALAAATDPQLDPDRRAWHRGQAVLGTDEEAAIELEHSADRARARGGLGAVAAFLQHATELTPDPATRATRALAAAQAKLLSGGPEAALELLNVAAHGPLGDLQRARLTLLRAQVALHKSRGSEVPGILLDAARRLTPLDATLARETFLDALDAALVIGDPEIDVLEVAKAAGAAPAPPRTPQPKDLLLDGLATTLTSGFDVGAPGLKRALVAYRDSPLTDSEQDRRDDRWLRLACRNAVAILDDELLHTLASRNVQLAREAGALATLPDALRFLSITLVLMGEFARADELAVEATAITRATGGLHLRHAHIILAAWRGAQDETTELHTTIAQDVAHDTGSTEAAMAHYAMAVLHNATGNYSAAHQAAALALESHELALSNLVHPELIESTVRAGQPERAAEVVEQLCSRARVSGTPWALGMASGSLALTSTGSGAEDHYREAIAQLGNSRMSGYLARAHLVYGEWLRREGRRRDARDQLRTAHQLFTGMGAQSFAERAARELRATGEHPRARTPQPTDELTAQELHVARLVATGATSREVGAQLFLSPRTIEAHLRNIFRKLGITSRRQLAKIQLP